MKTERMIHMHLFLSSSPCVPNADRAILNPANGFVKLLSQALKHPIHCLYICSSPDDHEKNQYYSAEMAACFREAGFPFASLTVLDRRNAHLAGELVSDSNFIILAGGHVPTQNAFFENIRLRRHLAAYHGTVMGISAGTMNCASMVYAQPELPGESVDPNYRRFFPGLDLTWVNILPHYQQVKDDLLDGKRLYGDITLADSLGHSFLALPDGSFVYSHGGQTLLYGESYRVEDGIFTPFTKNGDCVRL